MVEDDSGDVLRSLRREMGAPKRTQPAAPSAASDGMSRRLSTINSAEDGDRDRLLEEALGARAEEGGMPIYDPVWGQPDYPPGHKPRPCQVFGVLCCPCCSGRGGVCGEKNKTVWKRIRFRAAVIFSVIQIILFVVSIILNRGFERPRDNPLLGPSVDTLLRMGAKESKHMLEEGQWWRVITAVMLHGGFLHIFMNVFSQFRIGVFLEEQWGSGLWLYIYWAGGVGANFVSMVLSPDKVGVGASGAIYSVMGGWLSWILCTWDDEGMNSSNKVGMLLQCVGYLLFGFVMSLAPMVDAGAHVAGFVFGLLLGWGAFFTFRGDTQNMLHEPLRLRLSRKQGHLCTGLGWVLLVAAAVYACFFLTLDSLDDPSLPPPASAAAAP